jgi:hypothetical protein
MTRCVACQKAHLKVSLKGLFQHDVGTNNVNRLRYHTVLRISHGMDSYECHNGLV